MDFIDNIKEETVIICNNSFKNKILNENKLLPIKFFTIDEFIRKYYFDYSEDTIIYIMEKYNVKYEIAKMYIDNLYYIDKEEYGVSKLDFLCKIKRELDDANLLIYNNNFINYIKNIKIIIYGIRITKYISKILLGLNYQVVEREYQSYIHSVYEASNEDAECEFVAYQICRLIDNGIDINKIKLTNIDKSYYNTLERIFGLFNLKVNIRYRSKINNYEAVKKFLSLYKDNLDIDTSFSSISKDMPGYDELINVINSYRIYNNHELLIYKLENSYTYDTLLSSGIEIIDYLDYVSDDSEYVFLMGFNDSLIPNSYTDTSYITDNIVSLVGIDDTSTLNKWLREDIIKSLKDIKNLTITYKLRDNKKSYYKSTLIDNFDLKNIDDRYLINYSNVYNKIKLGICYDNYLKYGIKSNEFDILNSNFDILYNSYDNKYQKIDRKQDKLQLSYSKMQIYNRCAFRYFLKEVLKLDKYTENFSTVIGQMVHFVMEKCLSNNEYDTDKYVDIYIEKEKREFTNKEKFFIEKYRKSLKELLDQVLLEREYMSFNKAMYEKRIEVEIDKNVLFVGIIDKILYYDDGFNTYLCLIDYKTGNDSVSLKYLKYGLDIQLPIYLYLTRKLELTNIRYLGFYLQKFDIKNKDYRLSGYTNSDTNITSILDKNYQNSKIIKNLNVNKDSTFSKRSKVLSDEEIVDIIDKTDSIIKKTINKIKDNDFKINPKVIDGENKGCLYCKYQDICNVKFDDYEYINTECKEESDG